MGITARQASQISWSVVRDEMLLFSPPSIGGEEIAEVVATLNTPWITTGPKVREFEERMARYLGVRTAHAVNSCTDAMLIALAALGVGPGDAVFVPDMTFCATANVVDHLGATPVIVDVDPITLNLDPELLERAVRSVQTTPGLTARAVMPVHYAGHPCEMDAIVSIATQHGLAVIEDAAHAFAARYRGALVGSVEDSPVPRVAAFSFYATKNLTTIEGGLLAGSPDLVDECRLWSLHGMSKDAWNRYGKGGSWYYEVVRPGYKCNMTDVQASIGIHQLARIEQFQERRREVTEAYAKGFADLDALQLPVELSHVESAWHLYPVRLHLDALTIDRARFIDELTARNIGTSVHFIPLHHHPYYAERYGLGPDDFPVSATEFLRLVSLPMHAGLSDRDVSDVVEAVTDVVTTFSR